MNFTIYDKNTGEIKRVGFCNDIDFYKQINNSTEGILEGIADCILDCVDVKKRILKKEGRKLKKDHEKELEQLKILNEIENEITFKAMNIMKNIAIAELIKEGKLPKDYNSKGGK